MINLSVPQPTGSDPVTRRVVATDALGFMMMRYNIPFPQAVSDLNVIINQYRANMSWRRKLRWLMGW